MADAKRRQVVQPYMRIASTGVASNPFPNARAGADAIQLREQVAMTPAAEPTDNPSQQPDLGRSLVNQVHGFNETILGPLTRASELLGRADPEGYVTAALPGLFAIRELGKGAARNLETFRRHGYQPGGKGRFAGEVLLGLTSPALWAMLAADKDSETHKALNNTADRLGASEIAVANSIRRRFSPSRQAGLRGSQPLPTGRGQNGR